MAKSKNLLTLLGSISKLAGIVSSGKYNDGELLHISLSIDALSENPSAVSVDRSRLAVVWRRSHEYIKIYPNGYLLIIITKSISRHGSAISNSVKKAGVAEGDFRIEECTGRVDQVIKMLNTDDCRAVLYFDDTPKSIVAELGSTSQKVGSVGEKSLRSAIASLSERLGY